MKLGLWLLFSAMASLAAAELPTITVNHDSTPIDRSCVVFIPPGTVIADTNADGVLRIVADNVVVRFAPHSELRGAAAGTPWDTLKGIGIRVEGHRGVRLENARVHGFKCGVVATRADGLFLDGGDFSDNYRQHLRSTPAAENAADWLYPQHNDEIKWRDEYGGAVCIEDSHGVTVKGIRVRRGQNGILLDRVVNSRVYDNDCSFLSGWGLALWRSSQNLVTRNAFDFCIRGYVDGVYNRGQDSAGMLCFEQSSGNVFAENSATHGGDGFFGFAGREAIGESWVDQERARLRRETGRQDVDALLPVPPALVNQSAPLGCNTNLLLDNDFSYAAAHGIEITFSHGNQILRNRLVEDAICGIWGGYSTGTLIAGNRIVGNGGMGYGRQRGGIDMEHASFNRILDNFFRNNKCAIYLWWNSNAPLAHFPWVMANDHGVRGNVIAGNKFVIDRNEPFHDLRPGQKLVVLQLSQQGDGHVRDNLFAKNRLRVDPALGQVLDVQPGCEPLTNGPVPDYTLPHPVILGHQHPVGARDGLGGRAAIIMDEWGPRDGESPPRRQR